MGNQLFKMKLFIVIIITLIHTSIWIINTKDIIKRDDIILNTRKNSYGNTVINQQNKKLTLWGHKKTSHITLRKTRPKSYKQSFKKGYIIPKVFIKLTTGISPFYLIATDVGFNPMEMCNGSTKSDKIGLVLKFRKGDPVKFFQKFFHTTVKNEYFLPWRGIHHVWIETHYCSTCDKFMNFQY